MSKQINKPITILADEFLHDIVNMINDSDLPYFIIENILKDCVKEVHMASQQQLKMDREQFLSFTNDTELNNASKTGDAN